MRQVFACLLALAVPVGARAADDVSPTRDAYVARADPFGETVAKVVYLNQGWTPSQSLDFYFTSQGSVMVPYDWFLALEQPDSDKPFRDEQNILRYRYLPQSASQKNPDGLPVGFVADNWRGRKWLGMTCAACHTNEIRYQNTAYRIDGAPTQGDVRAFLSSMIDALQRTLAESDKFDRFAKKVLKSSDGPATRELLKKQLAVVTEIRVNYNRRNFPGYDPSKPAPPPTDYNRLDAFGAIMNETYYHAEKAPANPVGTSKTANAPVSYPFLWNTPSQDLVQWIGLENGGLFSLARNVGEVLGVFADYSIPDDFLILGYPSTVRVLSLLQLEDWLKTLKSPPWPDAFPPIDQAAAAKGKAIYQASCVQCHVLTDWNNPNQPNKAFVSAEGTDPLTYNNIYGRKGPTGKLEGGFVNVVDITSHDRMPAQADGLTVVTNEVIGTIIADWRDSPPDPISRINFQKKADTRFLVATRSIGAMYKARSLNGIWATAPYLHNGSVPSLHELLLPPPQRSKSFSIGVKTFDPDRVGFLTDVPGLPKFNVNDAQGNPIPGNSNNGHTYGTTLSDDERHQLLEYLKTL